ncbi:MAG: hypothetical protein ACO20I_13095 [bacterium]|jgi:hypothetical protein|tara:strand:- start:670 stop:900 length:231 start_codon:yes stop_codon:yes gene_type:complete
MKQRKKAKGLAKAFEKMSHRKKGGTKGTFTAAATKAGHPDTPEGRKAFANAVLKDPNASPKMKKKANFYRNIISKE